MLDTQIDSTYTDQAGNKLLYSDDVSFTIFYDASAESWDRSDSGASWYTEYQLPNDSFLFGLNSSMWSVFNDKSGQTAYSFSEGLVLSVSKAETRGGLTSEGKWSLIGDFSVSIYINMYDYYNEYRSKSAVGFSVSLSDNQKVRNSVYFDGTDSIVLKSQYVSDIDLKYIGWFSLATATPDLTDKMVILNLSRSSDTISCSAIVNGITYSLESVQGAAWAGPCYVAVEAETEQINTLTAKFSGLYVDSGTTDISGLAKPDRGHSATFPEKSLIAVDASGLSIIDFDSKSLWARFYSDSTKYFDASTVNDIAASNGKIFCATDSGLYVFDFTNDNLTVVDTSGKGQSLDGLDKRNAYVRLSSVGGSPSLGYNQVNSVSSVQVGGSDYAAAATSSGIVILKDLGVSRSTINPYSNATKARFSEGGSLYWFCSDQQTGRAGLALKNDLLATYSGLAANFLPTATINKDSYLSLTIEEANCLGVGSYGGSDLAVIGHNHGIEVISYPQYIKSYGTATQVGTYITDGSFESYLGIDWFVSSNYYLPHIFAMRSTYWSSDSTYSIKFYVGDRTLEDNSYVSLWQDVDFTYIDYLLYDLNFVTSDYGSSVITEKFEVLIDNVVYKTYEETAADDSSKTYYDEAITTTNVIGQARLEFRLNVGDYRYSSHAYLTGKAYYLDNVRTNSVVTDYPIFTSGVLPIIRDVDVFMSGPEKKIIFINDTGVGFIDVDSNTMETFVPSTNIVSGSELNDVEVHS